jgi:hypothetical protein
MPGPGSYGNKKGKAKGSTKLTGRIQALAKKMASKRIKGLG